VNSSAKHPERLTTAADVVVTTGTTSLVLPPPHTKNTKDTW
jgi:hypothetical protein